MQQQLDDEDLLFTDEQEPELTTEPPTPLATTTPEREDFLGPPECLEKKYVYYNWLGLLWMSNFPS